VVVAWLSNLPNEVWSMVTGHSLYENFEWLPMIKFTWRIMMGTIVTVAVALCFKSEKAQPRTA
jgi:solute:Na+ symporter, SSS family